MRGNLKAAFWNKPKKFLKKHCRKIAAILLPFSLLTACKSPEVNPPVYQTGFISMDTYISLTVYGEKGEEAAKDCQGEIERLEALMSVTDPDSEVSKINLSGGEKVTVSGDTAAVIAQALQTGRESGGALDITLRPVVVEWGFTTGDYKVPDKETLKKLLENVDYKAVKLEGSSVTLPEGYQIDLGSAAKGFAGDKTVEILKEKGITSALINLGGNVQTVGKKPDGTDWRVAVRNPFNESNMCVLEVSDKALVTSGNYERYFEDENGARYHHIIDPADGYPADNGIVSATIIGDSGLSCDALSTAVFVMGSDKAEKLWREKGGFEMLLVTDDKKILITDGITDIFSNLSDMEVTVITSEGSEQADHSENEASQAAEPKTAEEFETAAAETDEKTESYLTEAAGEGGEQTAFQRECTDENGFLTEKAVESIDEILVENKKSEGKTYTGLFDFDGDGVPEVYLVYDGSDQELMPVDVFGLNGEYLGNFEGYCRGGYTRLGKRSNGVYVHSFYEHSADCRLNKMDRLVFDGGRLKTEPYFKAYAEAGKNNPLLETVDYFSESEEQRADFEKKPDKTFVYDDGALFYREGENWVSICAFDFSFDVSYEEMARKTAEVYNLYIKMEREAEETLNREGETFENAKESTAYFFDDFDGNGEYEAFFCAVGSGNMYFINSSHCEKIEYFDMTQNYFYFYRIGQLFIAQSFGNSAKCRIFGVNGETWYEPESSYGGMLLDGVYGPEAGTFFLYQSRYDASSNGGGHTWKPYLFYESGEEIKGIPVEREELYSVRQGESLLAELERLEGEGFTVCEIFCFLDKYYVVNYIMPVWGENENGETIFYTNRNYYNRYFAWNTFAVMEEKGLGRYAGGSIFE